MNIEPLWGHQEAGIADVLAAIARGQQRLLVTSPTGMGKTRIMCELIGHWLDEGLRVALYSNRKFLIEQTARVLANAGIDRGIRAAGWDGDDAFEPVQVCSLMTEESRVFKRGLWKLHDADCVLVDEAHCQVGDVARKILTAHQQAGAACVGFTATPVGLGSLYDELLVAGTVSEGRECGALIHCSTFGPDEPDLRKFKKLREGEDLSENQAREAMMRPGIFGRVWEWFEKLNPEHKPTILFAPGVRESIWFAEQFTAKGVSAAHIDGQEVWQNGQLERSNSSLRLEILRGSESGRIGVLCNRFVLREGIDAPWLAHGIFATVFGSLQSYLQSGGRLLRAHAGLETVTLQDHGGNWWRHGSLNADRVWRLDHTASMIAGLRADRLRNHTERQPFRCPQCGLISIAGRCRCGWQAKPGQKKSRPVISTDGQLVELHGDIYRPRRICQAPNGPALWERMYHRSRTAKGSRTFRAAMALFAQENYWQWPSTDWPLMPVKELDFYRLVADVPASELVPPEAP